MCKWVVITVSGICSFLSFSMSLLAFRLGDSGAFLFAGFGSFFGALFIVSIMRIRAEKGTFGNDKTFRKPGPVSFVPHWFIMSALIIMVIAVLAAVVIPILLHGS